MQQERIRAEFEQLRHLDDPIQIERALERGEEQLRSNLHPDPYIGERVRRRGGWWFWWWDCSWENTWELG